MAPYLNAKNQKIIMSHFLEKTVTKRQGDGRKQKGEAIETCQIRYALQKVQRGLREFISKKIEVINGSLKCKIELSTVLDVLN